jgi:SAM-dependent methyltransferase
LSAVKFAAQILLDANSPACLWRHPIQSLKVIVAILWNLLIKAEGKLIPGGGRECNVCNWHGRHFRSFISADEIIYHCICPGCGSFDRHRQLVLGVRRELANRKGWTPAVMVGFSLSTAVRFLLEHEGLARCFRTDIAIGDPRFAPDVVADLRSTPFADASIEWVFCSHVLEHIPELDECLAEIDRVLMPGGAAWIQVPFEPGQTKSQQIEIDPMRAHAHAWQFAPDFGTLIQRPGWSVTEVVAADEVSAADRDRYGIDPQERYWLVRKAG